MNAPPKLARRPPPADLVRQLEARFGERLSSNPSILERHGQGEAYHPIFAPDLVAFAQSEADVVAAVSLCGQYETPIIPFGAGTSLEGHFAALSGGVCLDLSQMNAVLRVGAEDLDCTVQPGVTRQQLNEHLRDQGLFFPIDPGAFASIGGMASTRASGTNAVRYGTMRENVLALRAVMADGRVIKTSARARKSSAGYDLTRLLVGSEGTLGVITEVTIRLYGIPEAISAAVCPFQDLHGAVNAVIETIQLGVPVARVELLDAVQMRAMNRWAKTDYVEAPTLLLEFHGTPGGVAEQAETVKAIALENGGRDFQWATSQADRDRLWKARHEALYACLQLRPGSKAWGTDVCVPISRLADCILQTQADLEGSTLMAPIIGHVGDGNFHVVFLLDPDSPAEFAEAERLNRRMVERAQAMDGTCTGEHGIGWGKIDALEAELGACVDYMRAIKTALDPKNIMNPGKVFRA